MRLYDYVSDMKETQNTLVLIRRNDCLVYNENDEIPYDFAYEDVDVLYETDTLCVVKLADEWHPKKDE